MYVRSFFPALFSAEPDVGVPRMYVVYPAPSKLLGTRLHLWLRRPDGESVGAHPSSDEVELFPSNAPDDATAQPAGVLLVRVLQLQVVAAPWRDSWDLVLMRQGGIPQWVDGGRMKTRELLDAIFRPAQEAEKSGKWRDKEGEFCVEVSVARKVRCSAWLLQLRGRATAGHPFLHTSECDPQRL